MNNLCICDEALSGYSDGGVRCPVHNKADGVNWNLPNKEKAKAVPPNKAIKIPVKGSTVDVPVNPADEPAVHKIGPHGAVFWETKKGPICVECNKPVNPAVPKNVRDKQLNPNNHMGEVRITPPAVPKEEWEKGYVYLDGKTVRWLVDRFSDGSAAGLEGIKVKATIPIHSKLASERREAIEQTIDAISDEEGWEDDGSRGYYKKKLLTKLNELKQ